MDRPVNYFRFSDIQQAYHPLPGNELDKEIWRRAELNADAWVHPDERMASPYWYLRITKRRRYYPSERPFQTLMLNYTIAKKASNDWYKNWAGTEQYYEAIAKGEKLDFVIPQLDIHNADLYRLTPRERLDAYLNIKINAIRPLLYLDRVAQFRTIDALARTPSRTFPHLPTDEIEFDRQKWVKLHPAWWLPRALGTIRYALLGGRLPQTKYFDRDQHILWREHRIEARKFARSEKRLNDSDPRTAIRYVRLGPNPPALIRRALPLYHRLYRNYIESLQFPQQWGTAIKSWGIKVPILLMTVGGIWRYMQNPRILTEDMDVPAFLQRRHQQLRIVYNTPVSEERKDQMMELKYPRKV